MNRPETDFSVLLSTPWVGGAGGVERYAFAATHALVAAGVNVLVVYEELKGGEWGILPPNVDIISGADMGRIHHVGRRFGGFALSRRERRTLARSRSIFDVHLALGKRPSVTHLTNARLRLINPSGKWVGPGTLPKYDAVAAQAPTNSEFLVDVPAVLLPPPVPDLPAPVAPKAGALPSDFLLTVFNPYAPIKGTNELEHIVDQLPLPLVWCHSEQTISFEMPTFLAGHPKIIHVDGPSPGQMRWLYERTSAYISFSHSEGFGWSIADALRYSSRVISRHTGVMSFPQIKNLDGVVAYDSPPEVLDHLASTPFGRAPRALPWLSADYFVQNLIDLSREGLILGLADGATIAAKI